MVIPLESFLLFSLLPDFWKLFFIVLSCFTLLSFPAWIIFYPVNFFLPCLHQLIITLTDFLFLLNSKSKPWTNQKYTKWLVHITWVRSWNEQTYLPCSSGFHFIYMTYTQFSVERRWGNGYKNVDFEHYTLFLCFTHHNGIW